MRAEPGDRRICVCARRVNMERRGRLGCAESKEYQVGARGSRSDSGDFECAW